MKAIRIKEEAHRLNVTVENVKRTFEKAMAEGRVHGFLDTKNEEFMLYEPEEINAFVELLNSGRVPLSNLSRELNLGTSKIRSVIEHLLRESRIDGVLADDETFISNKTLRQLVIDAAQKNERIDEQELSNQLLVLETAIRLIIKDIAEQVLSVVSAYSQIRIADLIYEIKLPEVVAVALLKKLIREGRLLGNLDMINNVLIVERAPQQPQRTIENKRQLTQNPKALTSKPSNAWYIVPLFFGLIGGLIGYLVVKDEDKDMATGLLWFGVFVSVIYVIIVWAYWSWILSLF